MSWKKTGIIRDSLRIPQADARRRAKQLFEEFPGATYLTEIEAWRTSPGSTVELTVKRLEAPIDEAD